MTARNKKPLTIVSVTLDRYTTGGSANAVFEVKFNRDVSSMRPKNIEYVYANDELDAWNKAKKEWGAE